MNMVVNTEGVAEVQPNPEVMEKWATALESGDYPQTTGTLQRTTDEYGTVGFCCLGVLCDLAVKEGVIPAPDVTRRGMVVYPDGTELGETSALPEAVRVWAGLDNVDPNVDYTLTDEEIADEYLYGDFEEVDEVDRTDRDTLASLNDERRRDFTSIAQIIRENFLS